MSFQQDEKILTIAQVKAIFKKYELMKEIKPNVKFDEVIDSLEPVFDKSGAVMLPYAGMWVGIEKDGYAHT